jgi:replication factor C small subunit
LSSINIIVVQGLEPVLWSVKYKPVKWDDFIGQEAAISQLRSLANSNNFPNMILYGPYGTGKSSAAMTYARQILDDDFASNFKILNIRDLSAYSVSKAKRSIQALAKMDRTDRTELDEYMSIVFNEAKTELKLKGRGKNPNRSQLLQTAIRIFASSISVSAEKVKILILDDADALNYSMQQALRRTMEIYSEACRFILITPSFSGWSPAIVSRCLVIRFPAVTLTSSEEYVNKIATAEGIEITPEGLAAIARESNGDLRRAANLLQVASSLTKQVTENSVYECSETVISREVRKMVSYALKGSFLRAREKLRAILALEGYSPREVILEIERDLNRRPFSSELLRSILERVAEIDFRMTESKNPFIQLTALLASICKISVSTEPSEEV